MPSLFKRSLLPKLRSFPLTADAVTILSGAAEFRRCLLEKIAQATHRIYIVALYLQQDEAGQEILDAFLLLAPVGLVFAPSGRAFV